MIAFEKILIAVDNSTFADHAAKMGFELARKFNSHVGLVHITEPSIVPPAVADTSLGMPLQSGIDINSAEMVDVQNEVSDNIILQTENKYGEGMTVSHFNDLGATADGIIKCSKEFNAGLIVLGTHNRSGLDRFFMGSIAEEVVRNADIPVLVVPGDEPVIQS